MLRKWSKSLVALLLLVSVGLLTASAQSDSSKASQGHAIAQRLRNKLPAGFAQDQAGKLLEQALANLEHCLNSGKLKDEQVKALQDELAAMRKQLEAEQGQIKELREANKERKESIEERKEASEASEERANIQEKRISLYKSVVDDYEKEVLKLRAKLARANFWGNVKLAGGLIMGTVIGVAASRH